MPNYSEKVIDKLREGDGTGLLTGNEGAGLLVGDGWLKALSEQHLQDLKVNCLQPLLYKDCRDSSPFKRPVP
jgi:hypothetical protein